MKRRKLFAACMATQLLLSQAQRIGRWFAQQRLAVGVVRNSPWCRTRDTARLAFGLSDDWGARAHIVEDRSAAQARLGRLRVP